MFKVNQKIWCAIYGAGVVARIRQEAEVDYPVVVLFKSNGGENEITYTADGKYYAGGNVTLFPYPVEITKAITKPSIDWDHVSEDFQYLAMDSGGLHHLFVEKPEPADEEWGTNARYIYAGQFASLVHGTCEWRDSLVKRPE